MRNVIRVVLALLHPESWPFLCIALVMCGLLVLCLLALVFAGEAIL